MMKTEIDHPEQMNLREMAAESSEISASKGFYDPPPPFATAMFLLASEIVEAGEAWRKWGLADKTPKHEPGSVGSMDEVFHGPPRPEGVGSEFADIFIRLLVYVHMFDPAGDFYDEVDDWSGAFSCFDHKTDFLSNMNSLLHFVARATVAYELSDLFVDSFASIYMMLLQLCELYGIDLYAEYTRKMEYNKTRPCKHGGKRA